MLNITHCARFNELLLNSGHDRDIFFSASVQKKVLIELFRGLLGELPTQELSGVHKVTSESLRDLFLLVSVTREP